MRRTLVVFIVLALAASIAAALLYAGKTGFGGGEPETLTVVVEGIDRLVPGRKLYGSAQVYASAPFTFRTVNARIRYGAEKVSIKVPVGEIIEESRRKLEEIVARGGSPEPLGAATITVTLYLYDDRGNHYIAVARRGSYDVALEKTRDPRKAFEMVRRDPYLLYHSVSVLVFRADEFAIRNVTYEYNWIARNIYGIPEPRKPSSDTSASSISGTGEPIKPSVTLSCFDVVTMDNYYVYHDVYGFDFNEDDFIAIPEIYDANMPPDFAERVYGVDPAKLYKRFRLLFSTAVYVPDTCVEPVDFARNEWFKVDSGLMPLEDFWSAIMGKKVEWQDVAPEDEYEYMFDMPILRLIGVCGHDCNQVEPTIAINLAYANYRYYVSGLSVLGYIIAGDEEEVLDITNSGESLDPMRAARGKIVYITADIKRHWLGDGVYVDYRVEPVYIYNFREHRSYRFWRVTPLVVFTPLHHDKILKLSAVVVDPSDPYYGELLDKFIKMKGVIIVSPRKIYDEVVTRYDFPHEDIDSTVSDSYNADELAGAVYGITEEALKELVATIVSRALPAFSKLVTAAGAVIGYSYANQEAKATSIVLARTSRVSGDSVHVVVYKHVQALLNTTSGGPLALTYEVHFNPDGGGPPPHPPYPPTGRNGED